MVGIRVGGRAVAVPASALASFDPATGTGGTIVDAGTMFTRLSPPCTWPCRRRARAPVSAPLGGFDTCYNMTGGGVRVPSVTFTFAGGARAAVTLPEENVMIHSSSGGVACLASMQQQNHRVLFDVANGRVGFSRELCTA
ncbi:aspartyl protease 25-like [Triticum dicoccoides]|uniref:aspartyl protease 25-like n=1 Tax=Triticum dicoccoides TaxID=85692 RepID=UPI000E7B929D|nr:aspartyl protease 25-like [Triticum dicoccoides]